jgi:hypothetical protein
LPHEDQWEYACRGGKGKEQPYYVGDKLGPSQANTFDSKLARTARVGSYERAAPHPWGLCDMHGNVSEWCVHKDDANDEMFRGGSWNCLLEDCRSGMRADRAAPNFASPRIGVRLAVLPAMTMPPLVGNYLRHAQALLVRPEAERERKVFPVTDLFEPGTVQLSDAGQLKLDDSIKWLKQAIAPAGAEVVIVAYSSYGSKNQGLSDRELTRRWSEVVCDFLKSQRAFKKGNFTDCRATPLGLGMNRPPLPEVEKLPTDRVEIIVFVPGKK